MAERSVRRQKGEPAPARLLLVTTVSVVVAESVYMAMMGSAPAEIAADAFIVGALLWCIGYILMARPLAAARAGRLESEARLRDYTDAASDWQWESDAEHRIAFVSDQFTRATGVQSNLALGKRRWEIATNTDETDWQAHIAQLEAHEPFRDLEYIILDANKRTRWIRVNGIPVFDAGGAFAGYRGTGIDVTAEKNAELELRRTTALLKGVLDSSLDGFVVAATIRDERGRIEDFRIARVNARAEQLFGSPAALLTGKLLRARLPGLLDDDLFAQCTAAVENGTAFDLEHAVRRGEAEKIYRVVGVKLDDGVVITISDVTEERRASRQARLAATIFETAGEAMMLTDSQRRILAVNPTFTEITGYPPEEIIGKTPRILASGHHDREFYEDMWAAIKAAGRWQGEIWNRRKDGQVYAQRAVISTVRDGDESVSHYVAVFADVTVEKRMNDHLAFHAQHDPLTGLPNRLLLADRVERMVQLAIREDKGFALFFIDLDGFKPINDALGHLAGDAVLKEIAARLGGTVRESDTVARIGGDEFVVASNGVGTPEEAEALAAKLIDCLSEPIVLEEGDVRVGASIGVAHHPRDGADLATLLAAADAAMYEAKRSGKGTWRVAHPSCLSPSTSST